MEKQELRIQMIQKLKKLTKKCRQTFNKDLMNQFLASDEWESAKIVAVTLSRATEVNTEWIIQEAWNQRKQVVIPYSGNKRKLSFYVYNSTTELEKSSFGLWEPADRSKEILPEEIDLMIVPGLSYSKDGYRIGFGGGYYDRYLANYKGKTVSLLYPFQLEESTQIVAEPFDIPVQKLFIASE